MAEPNCPKCRTVAMRRARINDLDSVVHWCPACHGLWLPGEAMTGFLRDDPRLLTPPRKARESDYLCPTCLEPMAAFRYLQTYVTIDLCRACKGVWLDERELKEIRTVRRHHRNEGTLEELPPVEGVKGTLIDFVNRAIASLSDFTD